MKINSTLQQSPQPITNNQDLRTQKKANACDFKEISTSKHYLVEPLKAAGCGFSLYRNIPKIKGAYPLPTTIFVATGLSTLMDIGLKRYNGYEKLSSYLTKKEAKQKKLSYRMEKTVGRLNLGLQTASLYFIFKGRLRKKAPKTPFFLGLRPNPFTFPVYTPLNVTTALYNPAYRLNDVYGNASQENLVEFQAETVSVATRKKDFFEVACYKMATEKFLKVLITPSDLKDPSTYFESFKNSCVSSVQEKLSLIQELKKKFTENLAYLLNVIKGQVESYFVKI